MLWTWFEREETSDFNVETPKWGEKRIFDGSVAHLVLCWWWFGKRRSVRERRRINELERKIRMKMKKMERWGEDETWVIWWAKWIKEWRVREENFFFLLCMSVNDSIQEDERWSRFLLFRPFNLSPLLSPIFRPHVDDPPSRAGLISSSAPLPPLWMKQKRKKRKWKVNEWEAMNATQLVSYKVQHFLQKILLLLLSSSFLPTFLQNELQFKYTSAFRYDYSGFILIGYPTFNCTNQHKNSFWNLTIRI